MKYDFVFVVLVYRSIDDLKDFFLHLAVDNSKVIVINSYYDAETEKEFEKLAKKHGADFLSIPNKGYGYGNNRGCEYALSHYRFDFLIISNADILVEELDRSQLDLTVITAPNIKTIKGKSQNPAKPYKIPYIDDFMYYCITRKHFRLFWIPIIVNRICRELFYVLNRLLGKCEIYEPHGAFIIFPYDIIKCEYPLFNENMFLFAEEDHIAMKFLMNHIKVVYNDKIKITHKEDGSVSTIQNISEMSRNSFVTYYRYWYRK